MAEKEKHQAELTVKTVKDYGKKLWVVGKIMGTTEMCFTVWDQKLWPHFKEGVSLTIVYENQESKGKIYPTIVEVTTAQQQNSTGLGGDSSSGHSAGSSGKDDIIVYQNNFVALLNLIGNLGCEYSIEHINKLAWALSWLNVKANHGVQHGKITTERLLEIVAEIVGRPEQAKNPEPTEIPATDTPDPEADNYVPF